MGFAKSRTEQLTHILKECVCIRCVYIHIKVIAIALKAKKKLVRKVNI